MTKKTKIIFFSILFIQVLIITSLLLYIYYKQNNILSKVSITPLKKENLIFPKNSSNLKYFYELKPDILPIENPDWLSYKATYTINKDGLNERFDYSTKKAPDVFRIITIGDSFTFGAYVNTPDNFPEKLEDIFQTTSFCKAKKIEVINLGVPGYDIEYAVTRLKLRGIKYNPDMVLLFVKNDDFKMNNEIMRPAQLKYRKEFKNPAPGNYPWNTMAIKEAYEKYGEEAVLNLQIEIMKSITDNFKKKLVLLTFPQTIKKYKDILTNFINSRPQTYFHDNLPDIYAPDMPNAHLPDTHPSTEGHRLIASSVFEYLKQNKLISCQ